MSQTHRPLAILAIAGLALAAGCSDNNGAPDAVVGPAVAPFQEILDQGLDRYLGQYTPMLSEAEGGVVNHSFGAGDGPLCRDGSEYSMATRDTGSDALLIYLQGGGACWPGLCVGTENVDKGIPATGILDPDLPGNPVGAWNTVFVPYCDGGLHGSDADRDSNGDGTADLPQRGLHNLSAALDVAVTTFPAPRRIVLAGESAGGFGTLFALPLVRHLYPGVPIDLINDSGLGVLRPDDSAFIRQRLADWNMAGVFPASCANCIGEDGHLTDFHKWLLAQDDTLRLSMMSYTRDAVVALTFAQVGGEVFERELLAEMQDLEAAYPDRVRSFIADGSAHTFLLDDLGKTAGGVTVLDWVSAMLAGSDDWVSTSD